MENKRIVDLLGIVLGNAKGTNGDDRKQINREFRENTGELERNSPATHRETRKTRWNTLQSVQETQDGNTRHS